MVSKNFADLARLGRYVRDLPEVRLSSSRSETNLADRTPVEPLGVSDGAAAERKRPDDKYPALKGLRIGCVQYLNAIPLIVDYAGPVHFDHPSALARDLRAGLLDVALVPVFEALRQPIYPLVEGVGIASDGPVFSVFLAHRGPLESVRRIALDPASLTSVHLLQVLLREYHGLSPECRTPAKLSGPPDAELLIGNQAIEFRERDRSAWQILDLGAEWKRCTDLPFVYAPWLLRPDLPAAEKVAADLRALQSAGAPQIAKIAARETVGTQVFREKYLTEHIQFRLGLQEKAGIEKFRQLLIKHRFIEPSARVLRFL